MTIILFQISILALLAGSQAQVVQYAHPYAAGYPYGVAHPVVAQAPTVTVKAAPVVAAPVAIAPPAAPSSQFQAQDEFGNLQYGYANINSQKHEVGNTYGGVSGSYSYVDANGVVQTTNYIADALGFRVQATNLPVAPEAPEAPELKAPVFDLEAPVFDGVQAPAPVFDLVGPAPVEDTPEVVAAKAAFQAAFDEAASREKRSPPAATPPLVAAPAPVVAPAAYPYAYAHPYAAAPLAAPAAYPYAAAPLAAPYAAPAAVVASAPATREADLTTIKLNPGHAVHYRVF